MGCRVGASTDPLERIAHWKSAEGHTFGYVLRSGLTYEQAQAAEAREAEARRARGCRRAPAPAQAGGAVYSVYLVDGGTVA